MPGYTSSPPARGCSATRPSCGSRPSVVPASAGVFPARRFPHCQLAGRPRQRGGVPGPLDEGLDVLCRPRQRGGVPGFGGSVYSVNMSSPPARGCSPAAMARVLGSRVVPASAGVLPAPRSEPPTCARRPRQRGGVPKSETFRAIVDASSPPARGCSGHPSRHPTRQSVVPASAGVFPHERYQDQAEGRRPRQRGGVPVLRLGRHLVPVSSPPARGCSLRRIVDLIAAKVVPASAGVFRSMSQSRRRR